MEILKTLAPRYWLGYCLMYVLSSIAGSVRYRHSLAEPSGNEDLYTLAAIFGVAAGIALMSAIITEVVGYVVLLIPRRIREIKEEGLAEGLVKGRSEGREEGRAEGRSEGRSEGVSEGVSQERGRVSNLRARYERGEITLDEFMSRISDNGHCDCCNRSG